MLIKKLVKRILPSGLIRLIRLVREKKRKWQSVTYPIVQYPESEFETVSKIKDETWEDTYYAEGYRHNREQHLQVFSPALYIFRTCKGVVNANSDVVLTDKGAYWCKYNQDEFLTWAVTSDGNVTWYDRNNIGIVKSKKQEFIPGKVLSLIGLWSNHWVHHFYEYLPKLFAAGEAGVLNQPIKLLIVENVDSNVKEAINNYLADFPLVEIQFAKYGIDYTCEDLYFIPNMGPCCSDYRFRLDYPFVIPKYVIDKVYQYVVNPIIEKVKNNKPKYDKLYMGRNNRSAKNARTVSNEEEVSNYLKSIGYVDFEGAGLTLEEKADIIYHAKEIVAAFGSSLLNLMFSNKANCMVLGNYKFSIEPIFYCFVREKVGRYVYVTGQDEAAEYQCNYYIPLEKIKKVYDEYIKS